MLVGTVMKAFVSSHSAVICPRCQSLMLVITPKPPADLDANRTLEFVRCVRPHCSLHGKTFTVKRETVDLIEADAFEAKAT